MRGRRIGNRLVFPARGNNKPECPEGYRPTSDPFVFEKLPETPEKPTVNTKIYTIDMEFENGESPDSLER